MQPIEKALKIVFEQGVADNYTYPTSEFLADDFGLGGDIRNPFYGDTPKPVKFMFGTQKELNVWLIQTEDKYPVVWLVYPISESYNNNPQNFYTYKGARLVFAHNTDCDKLVQVRLQTTKYVLNQLIDKFTALMRNSHFKKFVLIDKQINVKETFYPNYSINSQKDGGNVEIWDAITFDCDLHLMTDCLPKN